MKKITLFLIMVCILNISCKQTRKDSESIQTTRVSIKLTGQNPKIDPMIYGQMLEDCNDHIIYGGIINQDGGERPHVTELLRPLQIPVVRWPGGTFVLEYDWQNGIGPASSRPTVDNHAWGGKETHLFGTDEFLAWCNKLNTSPYINFNMGNHPVYGGSLEDALNWIEYVNGAKETAYGQKRENNGHGEPYNVRFWGIGNENWGSGGRHTKETAEVYSKKLFDWASAIRSRYPDLQLLAVGHTYDWDDTVLQKAGGLIDFLTQHYYITSKVKDGLLQNPESSLFAPVMVEAHIKKVGELVKRVNQNLGRMDHPIRLSIDEWNNRHSVFDGQEYKFTRNDARRLFDVAIAAGMLNVFIRQSSIVGMANYIFPVNGHGLIKTVGDNDAYITPVYYVFEQYRHWMIGMKLDVNIEGPGISTSNAKLTLHGDASEMDLGVETLSYIDVVAVLTSDGTINVALINRSSYKSQEVKLNLPKNYVTRKKWELTNSDINAANTIENRAKIVPKIVDITDDIDNKAITVPPCGLNLIQCIIK